MSLSRCTQWDYNSSMPSIAAYFWRNHPYFACDIFFPRKILCHTAFPSFVNHTYKSSINQLCNIVCLLLQPLLWKVSDTWRRHICTLNPILSLNAILFFFYLIDFLWDKNWWISNKRPFSIKMGKNNEIIYNVIYKYLFSSFFSTQRKDTFNLPHSSWWSTDQIWSVGCFHLGREDGDQLFFLMPNCTFSLPFFSGLGKNTTPYFIDCAQVIHNIHPGDKINYNAAKRPWKLWACDFAIFLITHVTGWNWSWRKWKSGLCKNWVQTVTQK